MSTNKDWHTAVCGYQGHVYTREVGPIDNTIYMDNVYDRIQWTEEGPDKAAVQVATARAEVQEDYYCPYCGEYVVAEKCSCGG